MPIPLKRLSGLILAALIPLSLAACQTIDQRGFTRAQTEMLRAQGFTETEQGWELSIADRLLFDVDSAALKPAMVAVIERMASGLIAVGINAARVEGHSDSTGTAEHNARLSLERARAVAAEMQAHGFAASNLALHSHGEARPIADNSTEAGRAENRRVVIIVTAR